MRNVSNKMSSDSINRVLRNCVARSCVGQRFELVHKLPSDAERAYEWITALRLPDCYRTSLDEYRRKTFICSKHFRPSDYKNPISRFLNLTAVPTLYLDGPDDDQVQPPPPKVRRGRDESEIYKPNADILKRSEQTRLKLLRERFEQKQGDIKIITDVTINDEQLLANIIEECPHGAFDRIQEYLNEPDVSLIDDPIQLDPQIKNKEDSYTVFVLESNDEDIDQESVVIESDDAQYEDEPVDLNDDTFLAVPDKEVMGDTLIPIKLPGYSEPLALNNIWLRDHCRCPDCYDSDNYQRKLDLLEIPIDVQPIECYVDDKEQTVKVTWMDNHESIYKISDLMSYQSPKSETIVERTLWTSETPELIQIARVQLNELLCDDKSIRSILESLIKFGVAFVTNVPANEQCTEVTIKRLFSIHKTLFGEMWTFSNNPVHSDSAYSKDALLAHTDNTYFSDAAGLQVLHCIKPGGEGGDTILVDGFKVLDDFKNQNDPIFDRLCKINVPGEYIEQGEHHKFSAPIIRFDPNGKLEQIRYNMSDRAPFNALPQEEMFQFYSDLRALTLTLRQPIYEWKFKLEPGTVLIFDNWRVLHGRTAFSGSRQMTGCYVSRTEYQSKARQLGLID